jgi:hypothetical protein
MKQEKYIGMDVHQATISVAVMDSQGKLIMEITGCCDIHHMSANGFDSYARI